MELDRNSWFVKYWLRLGCTELGYLLLLQNGTTDICQVGRIAFVYAPIWLALFISPVGFLIYGLMYHLAATISILVMISVLFGTAALTATFCMYLQRLFSRERQVDSVFGQWYAAWYAAKKGKYCSKVIIN